MDCPFWWQRQRLVSTVHMLMSSDKSLQSVTKVFH